MLKARQKMRHRLIETTPIVIMSMPKIYAKQMVSKPQSIPHVPQESDGRLHLAQ